MSSHEKLSAASNDRKARLAQLKSLKRKQAPTDEQTTDAPEDTSTGLNPPLSKELSKSPTPDVNTYLSGRNYDPSTRNVKLGFASPPSDPNSLESRAAQLALATKAQQELEKADDKGLDFAKLQPKKPNWDLKRDLREKMQGLDVQTENAIAKLVRERVEVRRKEREEKISGIGGGAVQGGGEGEEVGLDGSELVEVMHLKEREEEEDRRREEDEDVS